MDFFLLNVTNIPKKKNTKDTVPVCLLGNSPKGRTITVLSHMIQLSNFTAKKRKGLKALVTQSITFRHCNNGLLLLVVSS